MSASDTQRNIHSMVTAHDMKVWPLKKQKNGAISKCTVTCSCGDDSPVLFSNGEDWCQSHPQGESRSVRGA